MEHGQSFPRWLRPAPHSPDRTPREHPNGISLFVPLRPISLFLSHVALLGFRGNHSSKYCSGKSSAKVLSKLYQQWKDKAPGFAGSVGRHVITFPTADRAQAAAKLD